MLVALDPGMNSPGVAVFHDGTLTRAARANTSEHAGLPDGERWLRVARVISGIVLKYTAGPNRTLDVVFEKPQWYQRGKSKGDPNQLVGIAGVAANLTGVLSCWFSPLSIATPTPAEWIGQLSKECPTCVRERAARKGRKAPGHKKRATPWYAKACPDCHGSAWETPRGRYIRKRLHEPELALVPDQNDAIDAVGLGLWALGRLKPHTVFSNGRDGR